MLGIYDQFHQQVAEYVVELDKFASEHNLPDFLFEKPDHIAIKCAGADDYEEIVEGFKEHSDQITYINDGGRRLAAAQLPVSVSLGRFGAVEWVEIMEPRPEMVGQDYVGVEHSEFHFSHFPKARGILRKEGVDHKLRTNPGHDWINITFNDAGQELKLNNRPLSVIVPKEIESGEAIVIWKKSTKS